MFSRIARRALDISGRLWRRMRFRIGLRNDGVNIVVCGPPRSGTSLVFSQIAKALPDYSLALPNKGKSRELSAIHYCDRAGNQMGKRPGDVLRIAEIKRRTAKKTHFIICLRDPRDILVSRHQWHNPKGYWVHPARATSTVEKGTRARFGLLEYLKAVETAGRHVDANTTVTLLRYEDVTVGRISVPEVLAELGLSSADGGRPMPAEQPVYGVDERASAPPQPNSKRWRLPEHREKILHDFSDHPELFRYMELFGYGDDRSWFEMMSQNADYASRPS